MLRRTAFAAFAALLLSGCSYAYDLQAVVIDGKVAFVVSPSSPRHPDCIREITVETDDARAEATRRDDQEAVARGVFWDQSLSHEGGCQNEFPIVYGEPLKGSPLVYEGQGLPEGMQGQRANTVMPKLLRIGATYTVSTTSGSTGYGCGRFRITQDRKIENFGCG